MGSIVGIDDIEECMCIGHHKPDSFALRNNQPYSFPGNNQQNEAMLQCHVNSCTNIFFSVPVSLLYSVKNKTYYYYYYYYYYYHHHH